MSRLDLRPVLAELPPLPDLHDRGTILDLTAEYLTLSFPLSATSGIEAILVVRQFPGPFLSLSFLGSCCIPRTYGRALLRICQMLSVYAAIFTRVIAGYLARGFGACGRTPTPWTWVVVAWTDLVRRKRYWNRLIHGGRLLFIPLLTD